MPTQAKKGEWSDRKLETAIALSEGIETQREISARVGVDESTISHWKREPEFLKKIDDMTLALERHQLAGMLRRLDEQQDKTTIGKTDWLKIEEFKAKLRGMDKVKVDVNHKGEVGMVLQWQKDEDTNNPIQPTPGAKKVS